MIGQWQEKPSMIFSTQEHQQDLVYLSSQLSLVQLEKAPHTVS